MKVTIPAIPFLCAAWMSACGPKPGGTGDEPLTTSSGTSDEGGTAAPTPTTGGSEPPNPTTGGPTGPGPTGPTSDEPPGETSAPGTSTTGSEFIVAPDQGPAIDFCDLALQDCGDGLKCNPSGLETSNPFNGPPQCVPVVPGAKPHGAPCSVLGDPLDGTDDCMLGVVCLFPDDEGIGQCHSLCNIESGDPPSLDCPGGDQCVGLACQSCFWSFCDAPCDPRDLATCAAGEVCQLSADNWFCFPDASGEGGKDGDDCEFVNSCDPGLFCSFPETLPDCDGKGSGCCTPFCSTDKPNTCPGKADGEVCNPWYAEGQAPQGLETLGLCTLPQ